MKRVVLVNADIFEDERFEDIINAWPVQTSRFEMAGWLVHLWASVLRFEDSGVVGYTQLAVLASEGLSDALRGILDPVSILIDCGFVRRVDSQVVEIVGWEDWTGSIPLKRKKKAERQKRYRDKCRRLQGQVVENKEIDGNERRRLPDECRRLHDGSEQNQGVTDFGENFLGNYINSTIKKELIISNSNSLISNSDLIDSKKEKKIQKKEKKRFTVEEVEGGEADGLKPSEASRHDDVLVTMAAVHSEVWGCKTSPKTKAIKNTLKKLMVDDGFSPSDVAKAIRGMGNDPWEKRSRYNGWPYLVKHFERWLTMYSDGSASSGDAGSWGPWRDEGFLTKEDWEEHKKGGSNDG